MWLGFLVLSSFLVFGLWKENVRRKDKKQTIWMLPDIRAEAFGANFGAVNMLAASSQAVIKRWEWSQVSSYKVAPDSDEEPMEIVLTFDLTKFCQSEPQRTQIDPLSRINDSPDLRLHFLPKDDFHFF